MNLPAHMTQCFCHNCGVEFWMPTRFDAQCRMEGPAKKLFCPNGHAGVYGESEADKIRRELQKAQQNEAYLESRIKEEKAAAERIRLQLIAQKGETTKARKKLANFDAPKGKHLVVIEGSRA